MAILHYGEAVSTDDNYRPSRMGQLATWLNSNGYNVFRVSPSFSHWRREHRTEGVTPGTSEGTIIVVPTSAYESSLGLGRLRSLAQFSWRATRALRSLGPIDVVVVGYPPPGLTLGTRLALGRKVKIVVDVRDLWPDAVVSGRSALVAAKILGKLFALELGLANAGVAMSSTLLKRTPKRIRKMVIPLGAVWRPKLESSSQEGDRFTAVFVGSYSQLFTFTPMIEGWKRFVQTLDPDAEQPLLILHGLGDKEAMIDELVTGVSSVSQRGRIGADKVPDLLANSDVGIVPTRQDQGIVISNKVAEYLEAGCFLVHSLIPELHDELSDFGTAVSAEEADSWADGFAVAFAQKDKMRTNRTSRRDLAESRYGHDTVMKLWTEVIR